MTTPHTSFEALMPKSVGHLHSNGDFCRDRQIHPADWPVYLYTADQMREAIRAATEAAAKKCLALKPPDLDHAPGEYHRFDVTTLACAAAIRASGGKGEA